MPAKGKHRRPKSRSLTRGFVAAGTGGAALALPLLGGTAAQAAPAAAPVAAERTVAPATTVAAAAQAVAQKAGTVTYSVVAGDSLYKIAEDHSLNGGWKQLYKDNRKAVGADPALIHPGLELTIGAKAKAEAEPKAKPQAKAKAAPKAAEEAEASEKAERAADTARADRSERKAAPAAQAAAAPAKPAYANNLDGWIRESLDIMGRHGIPGSYEGIHRNIMRESSGNPLAINNWDINAINGTPSKGLLQVIQPTFDAYHVEGTSFDLFDPVANITAACNYAADRYGSIDNVNGPY
ncbi:LysM peptidoglycan-binding domain-containing protein [Streptomyces sp. NPDC006540]|jgi:LysM repeat protein|uniref:LysM peptidoglycan-binding domain-containing protein n=1 Tax=Streptomyces sp. NPDC006540 TaxID=3155353 RepID=UPI0033A2782C